MMAKSCVTASIFTSVILVAHGFSSGFPRNPGIYPRALGLQSYVYGGSNNAAQAESPRKSKSQP